MFNFFANDDLATSAPPPSQQVISSTPLASPVKQPPLKIKEKVVAVIPVHGRHPLLKHTIERLLNKNGCSAVICAGEPEDQKTCEDAGAIFIKHDNRYLGEKWNACFKRSKSLNPDAVLFMGSSDWVSDKWLSVMLPYLDNHTYVVGKAGCYFLDIATHTPSSYLKYNIKKIPTQYRLVYWPGYKFGSNPNTTHYRPDESIGIGRLISREGLEMIDYKPFHNTLNFGLDYNMFKKFKNEHKIVYNKSICSLSISTDLWINKHKFEEHWSNMIPSRRIDNPTAFCDTYFPEYNKIA